MIKMERITSIADILIKKAQGLLMVDGCLSTVIFSVSTDNIVPITFNNEMTKDDLAELMGEVAKNSEAIIMLVDAWMAIPKKDEPLPISLKDYKNKVDAIICTVYTPEEVRVRRIVYSKNDADKYTFFDMGWSDNVQIDSKSRFSNPFTT